MTRLLLVLVMMSACRHQVNTSYLEAATIDVPQNVRTVLIIDRSRPKNFGEALLEGMEGAATGELIQLDAQSAALAIDTLGAELEMTTRFRVIDFRVNGAAIDTSTWDREMASQAVIDLCQQAQCDAVISLESLDSDTLTTLEREGERYTKEERDAVEAAGDCADRACAGDYTYSATQQTDVVATFRMYDGRTGRILDERHGGFSSIDAADDATDEALHALPYEDRVYDGAAVLGSEYAYRISPHTVYVDRRIYNTGSPELRAGRKAIQLGDLAGAEAIWTKALQDTGVLKLRGRLLHNLAVAAEIRGDLDAALTLAGRAREVGKKWTMARYERVLQGRRINDDRVAAQLELPTAVPVALPQ